MLTRYVTIIIYENNYENDYIFFSTEVDLANDYDLYSACSNPTYVVLLIVMGIIKRLVLGAQKMIKALYQLIDSRPIRRRRIRLGFKHALKSVGYSL
jgi:hypothetical protein